ncbi:MAG: Fe-S cluster assembly protein SufD [Candidatus Hydrogenedens sp.]|nr:Fe-S cluster assembly protein SufD [Candidatus Hydrogenedens sp.]
MTESTQAQPKAHLLEALRALPANGSPEWLKQIRSSGASLFEQTPFPHTKMEEWRHTNIAPIVQTDYAPLTGPTAHGLTREDAAPWSFAAQGWPEIVFVDGYFAPELSSLDALPEGVVLASLHDALAGPEAAHAEQHLNRYLRDRNAYTALNSALIQDGLYLRAAKNAAPETPLHVLYLTSARGADTAANVRNLVILEQGAQVQLIESHGALPGAPQYLNNIVTEAALAPNARLEHYKVVSEADAGNHLATTETRLDRDSYYGAFGFSFRGQIVRNQVCVRLEGENAECNLVGLYLNDRDRLLDNALDITHVVPHCRSRILYKGILGDASKAVFAGKVHVHREAQQTDSDQLSNNLLLSDTATIDAKPQLEIYADDVKCTHGATIGSPPEEVVFYFRSRGIGEEMARAMLTYGFADEIVDEVEIEPLTERLNDYIFEKYSPIR